LATARADKRCGFGSAIFAVARWLMDCRSGKPGRR
jgi:hypothetical protein